MANRELNRLKVVLAEKKKTNKWLGEQLGKDKTTISKWCTNTCQPDLGSLMKTAKLLEVEVSVSAMLVDTHQKISLKFLFLSDIFLFPFVRQ